MRISFACLAFALVACGGQTTDIDGGTGNDASPSDASSNKDSATGSDASGASCSKTQACSSGQVCGYDETQGCAATTGTCFTGGAICNTFSPGCACDGTIINIACTGLPNGYSTAPLLHDGTCDGGL